MADALDATHIAALWPARKTSRIALAARSSAWPSGCAAHQPGCDPVAADQDRHGPPTRAAFARFVPIATRWSDNDAYGHLNNVVYYSLFDSAVNTILIEAGLLHPATSPIIGLVVESNCRFYSSLTYPEPAEIGVAVEHLGRSSVRHHLAASARAPQAAAAGRYTHVYVDRQTNGLFPIPKGHRELMATLKLP